MANYKIVGTEYTSPYFDFDADFFAQEMIEKCAEMDFQWQQIRMDEDGRVYAFAQNVWVFTREARWCYNGTPTPRLLTRLDGDEVSWQDFGIIRKTEIDSMDYKIVGTDGYKPHPSHMESIAAGLVSDAKARCEDWKEIRMDDNGLTFAYNVSPTKREFTWDWWGDGDAFRLTDLSTELEVGLNWATFGIIRTEEAEVDVKEDNAKLSDEELFEWKARNVKYQAGPTVWQHAHMEQTERTIAERQLWADEFASMIFSEVREMTKTPDITNERIALLWTAIDELRELFDELKTKTPDTVNIEESEEDEPEPIRLPDILWQAHFEQPLTTLTPEIITAISDWPDSALDIIAQAIADGRIVLGGA